MELKIIDWNMETPEKCQKRSNYALEGPHRIVKMNSNCGPHPLFIGLTQTSRDSYRSIRYPIDALSMSTGSVWHDLQHGDTHSPHGSLSPGRYFSTINVGTHTFGTSLCTYFTFINGFLLQTILCFPLFSCAQENFQSDPRCNTSSNSSTSM